MTTQKEIVEATNKNLIPNYGRLPVAMVRGEGSRIWDADGKEYLDFFTGFGACGVTGHCHPKVVSAIKDQAEELLSCGNLFTNAPQVELAEAITKNAFGGKVFFCHSGTEANETALKLARLAAGKDRYKIISFDNCFHGRTMGSLSLTPQKYQQGFEPMLPGNVKVPYGDINALAQAVDSQTAGVFVEPVQGEGGVNLPPEGFMKDLRALCDESEILMVCDEVWTAPARTGKWFAYQHYGIAPDVMTIGKATGGGAPVAACVAAPAWSDVLGPGKHGCTLGGNPLCAAAGVATMKLIAEEDLTTRAAQKGVEIVRRIRDEGIGRVRQVRGLGYMIGIQLDGPGKDIPNACMEKGLLINCTQQSILRLAPALTATDDDIDKGLDILTDVLRSA